MDAADTPTRVNGGGSIRRDATRRRVASRLFGDEPAPVRIDRFALIEKIGHGGMGRVYLAYDPMLDRRVAIKVLRDDPGGSAIDGRRILREAQALAKLGHPNVVAVYDAGVRADDVWMAMEYVDGVTLGAWLAEGRSVQSILRVFHDAGSGLAAAHEIGLVHRDFKPANVVVDRSSRPKVLDFGLARGSADVEQTDTASARGREHGGESLLDTALTHAGSVVGTPRYMAPEQHAGGPVGPLADQYAFCVALWEALCGAPPFAAADTASLARAKLSGPPAWPAETPVRRRVSDAIRRGLDADPERRWPVMAPLLEVLHEATATRTAARRLLGAGIVLVLAGGGIATVRELDRRAQIAGCARDGEEIEGVWNDEARVALRAALAAVDVGHAATTADRVLPWIDAQAAAWAKARTEVCLEGEVRAVWDSDLVDRSLWCLDSRRMELEALVAELGRADMQVVQKAVAAAAELSPVGPCRDRDLLVRLPRPPVDGREEVRAARAELARAGALRRAGKYAEGLAVARSTYERAREGTWPPLVAAARGSEANLLEITGAYEEAEAAGRQAYFAAARTGAWDVAAEAATELVLVTGVRLGRHDDGRTWAEHAEVALTHAGDAEGLLEALRSSSLGNVDAMTADYAQARALHERALAIRERTLGSEHPRVAHVLNDLGHVYLMTGDYAQARALWERALMILERVHGPDHPEVATLLQNLANVDYAAGDYGHARALNERSLRIREDALGREHPTVAGNLNNLANLDFETGDFVRARELYARALVVSEKALGPNHPDLALELNNLANLHLEIGDHGEARALCERALSIRERTYGPNHPEVADSLESLASVHAATGDYVRARASYERALAILEDRLGPEHPHVVTSLLGLAGVTVSDGRPADAVPYLERALAIRENRDSPRAELAEVRFRLAQAVWDANQSRARSIALGRQAEDDYREAGPSQAESLAEVQVWLAERDQSTRQ